MPGSTLLEGLKIVDMTTVLLGPYCTQTLSDMGAEVVKVEPKSGDIIRLVSRPAKTFKMGPTHLNLNRGKKSVDWNVKTPLGQEAMRRLLAESDVFIHNVREAAIDRIGLSFEDVKKIKPDIVYVHCLGFSKGGPYSGNPAYDDIIQGLSGATSLLPRVDGNEERRFVPMAIADKVTGLHAVYATLAAIIRRDKIGEAVHVEVPMLECVTSFILTENFDGAAMIPPTSKIGYERQLDPTRQPYETKDGWVIIAPYTDDRWIKCFEVLGASKILQDERVNDINKRRKNRQVMQVALTPLIREYTTEDILSLMAKMDIPSTKANDLTDLLDDPHLVATGFFKEQEHPTEGKLWEMQPPVKFNGIPKKAIRPAATIGQDTQEVLAELGLADETELNMKSGNS